MLMQKWRLKIARFLERIFLFVHSFLSMQFMCFFNRYLNKPPELFFETVIVHPSIFCVRKVGQFVRHYLQFNFLPRYHFGCSMVLLVATPEARQNVKVPNFWRFFIFFCFVRRFRCLGIVSILGTNTQSSRSLNRFLAFQRI